MFQHQPNDVRIDCKAAKHSDGDRGAVLAYLEADLREPRRPPSMDCSSAPIGARANKRRFVNLLQQLAGALDRLEHSKPLSLLCTFRFESTPHFIVSFTLFAFKK